MKGRWLVCRSARSSCSDFQIKSTPQETEIKGIVAETTDGKDRLTRKELLETTS